MIFTRLKVLNNRFPEIIQKLPNQASDIVAKVTFDGDAFMKDIVPVDTGRLKSTIQSRMIGSFSGEISLGTEYMWYLEYGTYKMRAQPFIGPTIENMRAEFNTECNRLAGEL